MKLCLFNMYVYLPLIPLGDTSVSFEPHSLRNPTATSTESSVGFSRSSVRISRHSTSWACNNQHSTQRQNEGRKEGRKEVFYLTMHSTHFIYAYMASDMWLRTILIARKETHCHHIGYSFRLAARTEGRRCFI